MLNVYLIRSEAWWTETAKVASGVEATLPALREHAADIVRCGKTVRMLKGLECNVPNAAAALFECEKFVLYF